MISWCAEVFLSLRLDSQGLTREEAATRQAAAWRALRCGGPKARIPGGGESVADLSARIVAGALIVTPIAVILSMLLHLGLLAGITSSLERWQLDRTASTAGVHNIGSVLLAKTPV